MRLLAVLAGALLAALAVQFPLRLLLPAGVQARQISGSIWQAQLAGAAWQGIALGDLESRMLAPKLSPLAARLLVTGPQLRALVLRGPAGLGATGVTADLAINLPALAVLGGLNLQLRDAGIALGPDGQCRAAWGQIRLTPAAAWAGGALLGTPRCDGPVLVLPLANNAGSTRLVLRSAGQQWQARLMVAISSEAQAAMLAAQGFQRQGAHMVKQIEAAA